MLISVAFFFLFSKGWTDCGWGGCLWASLGLCVDISPHWCHWCTVDSTNDVLGCFNHLLYSLYVLFCSFLARVMKCADQDRLSAMVIPRILNCPPAPPQLHWCRQGCVSLPSFLLLTLTVRLFFMHHLARLLISSWYQLSSLTYGGVIRVLHNRALLMSRSSTAVWIRVCGLGYFFFLWGCGHCNKPKPRLWPPAVPHGTFIGLILWIQLCPARKRKLVLSTGTQFQISTDIALCLLPTSSQNLK